MVFSRFSRKLGALATTTAFLLAVHAAAGGRSHPWDALDESLHAAVDSQLETLTKFGQLERQYQEWQQQQAKTEASTPQPHPARVHDFIRFFSTGGSGHYQASLSRLARYQPMIERTFAEEEVPRAMIWVGLVESGYDPLARSPKNALGIWQFIPGTAERFGLRTGGRDERTDPAKSTRAAARYLKFLYETFEDWPLALAAYNAGENRVASAIQRTGVHDFWQLARMGALPRETRDYVPAVLAAGLMEKGGQPANQARGLQRRGAKAGKRVQAPLAIVTGGADGI